jgi:hypothetical protein
MEKAAHDVRREQVMMRRQVANRLIERWSWKAALGLVGLCLLSGCNDWITTPSGQSDIEGKVSPTPSPSAETGRSRLTVEATLLDKAEAPDGGAYRNGLVMFVYQVKNVTQGEYPDNILLVYHWGLRDHKVVRETMAREVGKDYRLQVEAFPQRKDLEKTMAHAASAAGSRLDMPIYTDAEPLPKPVPPPSGGPSAGGVR